MFDCRKGTEECIRRDLDRVKFIKWTEFSSECVSFSKPNSLCPALFYPLSLYSYSKSFPIYYEVIVLLFMFWHSWPLTASQSLVGKQLAELITPSWRSDTFKLISSTAICIIAHLQAHTHAHTHTHRHTHRACSHITASHDVSEIASIVSRSL